MGFPLINPFLQFFDNSGNPLSGGKLFSYVIGTSTKKTTWSNADLSIQNTNPIILDDAGRCSIALTDGEQYKCVLCPADDTDPPTNPIATWDKVKSPQSLTLANLFAIGYFPQTDEEDDANITPANYAYLPGDIRRYGGSGDGTDET